MTPGDLRLLTAYLYWLRDRIVRSASAIEGAPFGGTARSNGRDLRATLVHELDVEIGWRARLRGAPVAAWGPESELRPEAVPSLDALVERWRVDEAEMRRWLGGLSAADLEAPVTVNGLEGYPLEVYLLHLVQHGVMEFTNAGAILTELGASPGDLGVLDALDDLGGGPGLPKALRRAPETSA